ncbi:MAG: nucleotidyltransferase domain-containing protein, partial [Nitrospirae bacterium]|nr:nucleotidyltransferase domain-containing protein [Nitrospirota bacterium]
MKTFEEIKNILSAHRSEIERQYKVKKIGVFGSAVSGKQRKKSDIDILVEFR